MNLLRRRLVISLSIVLSVPAASTAGAEQPAVSPAAVLSADAEKMLRGLFERRLYSVAAAYCTRELATLPGDAPQRPLWTVQLVRSRIEQAKNAPTDGQSALWTAAQEALVAGRKESPTAEHADRFSLLELDLELARCDLARWSLGPPQPQNADPFAAVRSDYLKATEKARALSADLARRLAAIPAAQGESRGQLSRVIQQVAWRCGQLELGFAICEVEGSRTGQQAILRAMADFDQLAAQLPNDPVIWRARIDRITCLRLLLKLEEAARQIRNLEQASPPADVLPLLRAEAARVELARKQPAVAIAYLTDDKLQPGPFTAELELARVETRVWQARQARSEGKEADATGYLAEARKTQQELNSQHGAYWGSRAQRLLRSAAP